MEEGRYYMCRSCRNQVLLVEDDMFMDDEMLKVVTGNNAVNVRVADAESRFLVLGCPVVRVFCNGCSTALGVKIWSQDATIPIPGGKFNFRLDLLLSPDGNPMADDDTDEEVVDESFLEGKKLFLF